MQQGISVQDLSFQYGGVPKLDGRSVSGIEDGLNFVAAVDDSCLQSLALLVFHSLRQLLQREPDKIIVQRSSGVVGESISEGLPRQCVVAQNRFLREVLHLMRADVV